MQEWIGVVLILGGISCRLWCERAGKSPGTLKKLRVAGANVALILAGCGIYLLAEPLWSDVPAAPAGAPAGSIFPVSLAAALLALGAIFSIGFFFNRNKSSSC